MTIQDPKPGRPPERRRLSQPEINEARLQANIAKAKERARLEAMPDYWTPRKFTQTALNIFTRDADDETREKAIQDGLSTLTALELGSSNAEVRNWATGLKRSMVREKMRRSGKLDEMEASIADAEERLEKAKASATFNAAGANTFGSQLPFMAPVTVQSAEIATIEEEIADLYQQAAYVSGKGVQPLYEDASAWSRFLNSATLGSLGSPGGQKTKVGSYSREGETYYIPDSILDYDLEFGMEDIDRLSRSAILMGKVKDVGDPHRTVIDAAGKDYDITGYVEEFSKPEVKNSLRRVLAGIDDRAVIPVISQAGSLSMGAVEQIGNRILPESFSDGYWWNTHTAAPGVKLRYLPRLYEDDDSGFRSWQALQDPAKFRAVMEVVGHMQQRGELGKGFWEQVGGMSVGMAEFVALAASVEGAVAKAAPKIGSLKQASRIGSIAERLPAIPWASQTGQKIAQLWGYGSKRPYWRGVQFGARDTVEEVMYGVAQGAIYPDMSISEGAMQGLGEGLMEAGIGIGSGLSRRMASKFLLSQLSDGHLFRRMAESRKWAADYNYQFDRMLNLPSGRVDIRKRIEGVFKEARRADALAKTFDALAVGAVFGSYESAVLDHGEQWERMSLEEKAGAMFSRLDSSEALGNMALFGGTAGAHYLANSQGWGSVSSTFNDEQRKAVDDIARTIVQDLSKPDSAKLMARYAEVFDQVKAENPELTKDLVFRAPGEQTSVDERVAYDAQYEAEGFAETPEGVVADAEKLQAEFLRSRITKQEGRDITYESTTALDDAATIWLYADPDEDLAVKRVDVAGTKGYAIVESGDPNAQVEGTHLWRYPWEAMVEVSNLVDQRAEEAEIAADLAKGQSRLSKKEGDGPALDEQLAEEQARQRRESRVKRKIDHWREFLSTKFEKPQEPVEGEPDPRGAMEFPTEKEWHKQAAGVGREILEAHLRGERVDKHLVQSIASLLHQVPDSRYAESIANGLDSVAEKINVVPESAVEPEERQALEDAGMFDPRQAREQPQKAVPDALERESKDREGMDARERLLEEARDMVDDAFLGYGFDPAAAEAMIARLDALPRGGYAEQRASDLRGALSEFQGAARRSGKGQQGRRPTEKPRRRDEPGTIVRAKRPKPEPEVEADPERVSRYQGGAAGQASTLYLAEGKKLDVTYRAVEADDLLPSHDARKGFKRNRGADKNERPYEDPTEGRASRRTVEDIAAKPAPALIFTDSPSPVDGPPIVTAEGLVLGGNARTMAMQLAYGRQGDAADQYRQAAVEFGQRVGIDAAALEGMTNPVIVREVATKDAGARGELSRALNESLTTARSSVADAASRGSKITPTVAKRIGEALGGGSLGDAFNSQKKTKAVVNLLVEAGALSQADVVETMEERGLLTQGGRERVQNALLGAVIPDVRRIAQLAPADKNKLLRSLPALVRLKEAWPGFLDHLNQALDGLTAIRKSRLSFEDALKQSTIEPEPWKDDPVAVALLGRFYGDSQLAWGKRMAEVEASLQDAEQGQAGMFEGVVAEDPRAALMGSLDAEGAYAQQDLAQQGEADEGGLFGQGQDAPSLEHPVARPDGSPQEVAIEIGADLEAGWQAILGGSREELAEVRKALQEAGLPFDYLAGSSDSKRDSRADGARIQLIEDGADRARLRDHGRGTFFGHLGRGTAEYVGRPLELSPDEGLTYRPELTAEPVLGGLLLGGITLEDARRLLDPRATQVDDQVRVGNRARSRVEFMQVPPGETPAERLARALKLQEAYTPPDPAGFKAGEGRYQIDELADQPRAPLVARLAQGGATSDKAARTLHDAGLSASADPSSQAAQDAIRAIVEEDAGKAGEQSAWRAFEERYGDKGIDEVAARYEDAVSAARAALAFSQLAALELARGDAKTDGVLRTYFRAKEDLARDGKISEPVRAELKRANMLGEDGFGIAPAVEGQLAQWMVDARQHALNLGGETYYSVDPFMAFGGPRLMDEHGVRLAPDGGRRGERFAKIVARSPRWVQWINRKVTKAVGRPTLAAGLPLIVRRQNYQSQAVLRTARAEEGADLVRAQEVAAQQTMPSGAPLPASVDRKLTRLMQKGGLKNIKTPKQLGQALGDQRWAYLFGNVKLMAEQADAMGADHVEIGFLTDEQVAARKGSYLMRERVRFDDRDMRDRMADQARMDLFAGRDLPVDAEADSAIAMDVLSSGYLHAKGMTQEARIRMFLRVLDGFVDRGVAIPYAEFQKKTARGKPLYDDVTRQWYEVATVKHAPTERVWDPAAGKIGVPKDLVNGRPIAARQTLLHDALLQLRERMGDPPEEGEEPRKGGHPYIQKMRDRLDLWLGTDDAPGVVLNQTDAAELEMIVRDMLETAPPVGSPKEAAEKGVLGEYVAKQMDDLTRYWRRTVTIGSPAHWTLARCSDVLTNWAHDFVGITDFITSVVFGKGTYADSMRSMLWWQRWKELGSPQGKDGAMPSELAAEGWTEDQWAAVLDVDWHAGYLIGGTFVTSLVESQALGTILGSAVRSDDLTRKMQAEMHRRGFRTEGRLREMEASFVDAIKEYGRRVSDGQAAYDRKIQESFDQGDTEHRLKAISDWTAQYQMYELLAKYAASLGLRRKNPMLSREAAATYGAQGTADYANTSPWLRRWTTSMNWMRGKEWDKLERMPGAMRFGRMMTQTPFLLYQSNMTPSLMRVALRRPHKVLLAMALQTMVAGAWAGLRGDDDDDEMRLNQALAGSYQQPGRPFISFEEAERLTEIISHAPGVGDWVKNDPAMNKRAKQLVMGLLAADTGSVRAPRRTRGETRYTDLSRLNPLLETTQAGVQAVRDIPAKSGWGLGRDLIRFLEGIVPTMGGAALSGVFEVAVPRDGQPRMEALIDVTSKLAGNMTSAFDPTLAPLSRQGQLGVQMSVLGGQPITDYIKGLENDYPLPASDRLAATVFGAVWSSQRVMRKSRYRPEADLARQVLDQLGVVDVDTKPAEARAWERATDLVTRQWLNTAQATYARWTDFGVQQGVVEQVSNLDAMMSENLLIHGDLDPEELARGRYRLREDRAPESSIGKMIARQSDADQARMIRVALRLAHGPGWEGGGKATLLEMGRMRQVDPEVFGGLYEATLRDPHGRGLLDWFHKHVIRDGSRADLAELHHLWLKVPRPAQPDRLELYDRIDGIIFPDGRGWPSSERKGAPSGSWGLGQDPDLLRTGEGAKEFIRRNR